MASRMILLYIKYQYLSHDIWFYIIYTSRIDGVFEKGERERDEIKIL